MKKVFVLLISLISFGTVLAETTIKATSFKGGVYNNSKENFVEDPNFIGVDIKMVGNSIYIYSSKTQVFKLVEYLKTYTEDDIECQAFRALALHLNGEESCVCVCLNNSGILGVSILVDGIGLKYYYKAKIYEVTE